VHRQQQPIGDVFKLFVGCLGLRPLRGQVQVIDCTVNVVDIPAGQQLFAFVHPPGDFSPISLGQRPLTLRFDLTVADVEAWPDILQAVTEDDIIEAAKSVFQREQAVTGFVSNTSNEVIQ